MYVCFICLYICCLNCFLFVCFCFCLIKVYLEHYRPKAKLSHPITQPVPLKYCVFIVQVGKIWFVFLLKHLEEEYLTHFFLKVR